MGAPESTGRVSRIVIAALAFCGCVAVTENVSHSLRGPRYPGYAIEHVEATPSPGTPLAEGSTVEFSFTVRYVLQARETGILELLFRNERDMDVLPPGVALPIARGGWQKATLTQTIQIPSGLSDLLVTIPVLPEGAPTSYGMLRVRYPVVPRH